MKQYKLNKKGINLYKKIKDIYIIINKLQDENKDILKEINIKLQLEILRSWIILREIEEGNGRKIRNYRFTKEDFEYIWDIDEWKHIEKYIEEMK